MAVSTQEILVIDGSLMSPSLVYEIFLVHGHLFHYPIHSLPLTISLHQVRTNIG